MQLLSPLAITTALVAAAGPPAQLQTAPRNLTVQATFTYGSGGTSADAWLQTSLDGGLTWTDIANFHFTTASARKVVNLSGATPVTSQVTPTDGAMAANTVQDGLIGPDLRVKYASAGTYGAGTALRVDIAGYTIAGRPA